MFEALGREVAAGWSTQWNVRGGSVCQHDGLQADSRPSESLLELHMALLQTAALAPEGEVGGSDINRREATTFQVKQREVKTESRA
jgi:hypothetical protein